MQSFWRTLRHKISNASRRILEEKMKLRARAILGLLLLMAACDDTPPGPVFSANAASRLLQQRMTEQDVVRTLGYQPVNTSLSTCGVPLRNPWQCKTITYMDSPYGRGPYGYVQTLTIYFQQNKTTGVWEVNGWNVL
jgi:hypothetical protein